MDTVSLYDFGNMDLSKATLEDGSYNFKVVSFQGYQSKAGKPWLKVKIAEINSGASAIDYLPVRGNSLWDSMRWKTEQFWEACGGSGIANFGEYDYENKTFPAMIGVELVATVRNEVNEKGYTDLKVVEYGV